MRATLTWVWFAVIQVISLIAMVIGWVLLVPFCLSRAWEVCASPLDSTRTIDRWRWKPLNALYGNPEDGVSGKGALIWNDAGQQVAYMPEADPRWRAYCWSAWRNSADNLKYVFAWKNGPLVTQPYSLFGKPRTLKVGWQPEGVSRVPVVSI